MNVLRIDVGVHTLLHIKLSDVNFEGIKAIVFTVKNYPAVDAPVVIERTFTESGFYEVMISPAESVLLQPGAEYDFNQVLIDGTRMKITDTGRIILRKGVGDYFV